MSLKRAGLVLTGLCASLFVWAEVRPHLRRVPAPDEVTLQQARRVRILRDRFGVPHIFGKSDADAAFGLAYAHAQDDWPTIQGVLAASRGRLSLLQLSKQALANDYYAQLVRVADQVESGWPQLSPGFRELLDSYARGLNLYASKHPGEADARLLPWRGRDIAAGFAHKLPLLVGAGSAIASLLDGEPPRVGEQAPGKGPESGGSNAHAVSASRSTDGVTRLNINSHQPWEGPVAWYEAHVHSEEGWNMTGGLFPASPVVLHGHNDHLGWAHTVNHPTLIDVYALGDKPAVEERQATIEIDLKILTITVHKKVLWDSHGAVIETKRGDYAVRWAGMGRALLAAEQWYRMDKASSLSEWRAAMELQAIPMFNTVYADAGHIGYVYNASLPIRSTRYQAGAVLPGNDPDAIPTRILPFAGLPQAWDPPSGYVFNTNSTPFQATSGAGNPDPTRYDPRFGIETSLDNRALRTLELFAGPDKISAEQFLRFKFDRQYSEESKLEDDLLDPIVGIVPADGDEREAQRLLGEWDRVADEGSPAASIAILAWRQVEKGAPPHEALAKALAFLRTHHGRITVPLGEVQRLHRGKIDLPLGGGPDVLNAAETDERGGRLVGKQGDSLIVIAEFTAAGARSRSIHQYGASNRKESPHYADQSPFFVRHELKPTFRDEAELRKNLEVEYFPGAE